MKPRWQSKFLLNKISQEDLVKEIFTESLDDRYAKMTRGERIGYWISVLVVIGIMGMIWLSTR